MLSSSRQPSDMDARQSCWQAGNANELADHPDLDKYVRQVAFLRRLLLDIARGPSEAARGPLHVDRTSHVSNRLSSYRVGLSILHAHASKRLPTLTKNVGWTVDVSLSDVIHAALHGVISSHGWKRGGARKAVMKLRSGGTERGKTLAASERLAVAKELIRQTYAFRTALGALVTACEELDDRHDSHAKLVLQLRRHFRLFGVLPDATSTNSVHALLDDLVIEMKRGCVHLSIEKVHTMAVQLGLDEDNPLVRLGWSNLVTSIFEQTLDRMLDNDEGWLLSRLPCHALFILHKQTENGAKIPLKDLRTGIQKHARKVFHHTIDIASARPDAASFNDGKVRNQIWYVVERLIRVDSASRRSTHYTNTNRVEMEPLGPLDKDAFQGLLISIADRSRKRLTFDRERWAVECRMPMLSTQGTDGRLHYVYLDVIGLSHLVWDRLGVSTMIGRGGALGRGCLSGQLAEEHEQFRRGALIGPQIDLSLVVFLVAFQRADVENVQEGPYALGGDEAHLVVFASPFALKKQITHVQTVLSEVLGSSDAPLQHKLPWEVHAVPNTMPVEFDSRLNRRRPPTTTTSRRPAQASTKKQRPAVGAPMWWLLTSSRHEESEHGEVLLTFPDIKHLKNVNRQGLDQEGVARQVLFQINESLD